jgi:hypothetical protein
MPRTLLSIVSTSLFPRAEIQLFEAPEALLTSFLVDAGAVLFSFISRSKLDVDSGKDRTGVEITVLSIDGGLDGDDTIMERMWLSASTLARLVKKRRAIL